MHSPQARDVLDRDWILSFERPIKTRLDYLLRVELSISCHESIMGNVAPMSEREGWIAVTGLRPFDADAKDTAIPTAVINDPDLSLIAKGIYGLTLSYQGQPVNPYADTFE